MRDLTDKSVKAWTNIKSTVEEAENWVELPLQCITLHLIWKEDLLALLLLVYTQMKTDIQESSTYILTYVEK